MTEPTSLAARAQKRYGPPENIELRYGGPFGTGEHRFSGWCVGFEWVTKYLAQELSDDEAACVAFFVTVENEVIVVYDLGPRNEFPDNRDSPSPDSVVQQFLTGCYRGKVSWLALHRHKNCHNNHDRL
ncbi:MAG: hypothetical protein O7F70_09770 [Gemmatimonadetes bacterium]|nr:hypothetical protein [Gemmatimonadota bacterium]